MANVQISDLPFAITPLVGATTFFEVEATEGGVVVSRRVAADDLVVSATTLFIKGTSIDDPAIGGGVFDGQLLWQNANGLQTGVFGFDPAGDNFIWSNDAEGGFHQIAIRDGTVLVETIAAAAGGLLVNNLLTGGGLERVLTAADVFNNIIIGTSTDDPTDPGGGGTYDATLAYQTSLFAATADVGFDPAGDTLRSFNRVRRGSFAVRVITGGGVEEDTYRYDGFAGSHTWLDVLNGGLTRMSMIAGNASVIMLGGVNLPSTGASQVGNFRMTLQDGTETGEMGFPSSVPDTILAIRNFIHGGTIRLFAEDGSGVEQLMFFADPDANTTMLHAGEQRFFTVASGAAAINAETADDPVLQLNENFIVQSTFTHDVSTDESIWENAQNGGSTIIRGRSDAGEVRDVIDIDYSSAGGFIIFSEPNGLRELMRLDTGVNAVTQKANSTNQPSGGFAQVGLFQVQNRNASPEIAMHVGFNGTVGQTTLELKNFVHGGPVELIGETAAGVERVLFFHDPDQVGPIFTGILDNDPTTDASIQDARMTFRNPSADNIWQIGFLDGTNDFSIRIFQDTGIISLRAPSAASGDRLLATFDPIADVKLFQAGIEIFRTVVAGSGGAELNNTLTGAGFERVLTTADISGSPFTEIILTNSNVIDLVDTDVALNIGAAVPGSNPHLEIGFTNGATDLGMQAKADATSVLELELNRMGGNVRVGSQNTAVAGATFLYASNGVSAGAVIETVISGMILEGKAGGSTVLDWHVVNGTLAMRGVFNGANFQFEGFIDSEEIRFQSRNSASAVRQMLHLDPDDDVQLYHPGTDLIAFRTTATGVDVRVDAAGDPTLTLTEDATLSVTLTHDVSTDITILRNEVNSGHLELRGRDSSGVDALLLRGDPDNQTTLFWDGTQRIRTAQQGTELIGSTASGSVLRMFSSAGTTLIGLLSFGSSQGEIQMLNNNGAAFQITGPDAGAVARTMFRADPDNTAALYHAGEIQIITRDDGMEVRGEGNNNPATGGTQDFFLRFVNDAIQEIGGIEFSAAIDMTLTNRVHGGNILIRGEDGGGVLQTMIDMDPDDDVEIFDDGVGVIRTQQAGLGGAEVNNTFTGAGYERVMTLTDADNLSIFDRNIADDNVPAVTFVTGVLTVTLEANSVYAVEYYLEFQTPNASGDDFVLRFDGAAAGWVGDAVLVCDNDAGTETFTQDLGGAPAATTTVNSDTTSNTFCKGTGVIVTDGTPGTFELDVAKSADAGGDGTFFANSWLRVQKLA